MSKKYIVIETQGQRAFKVAEFDTEHEAREYIKEHEGEARKNTKERQERTRRRGKL